MDSLESFSPHIAECPKHLHTLLFSIHDWFALLTNQTLWWNEYSCSLGDVVGEHIATKSDRVRRWICHANEQPLSSKSTLYKHYVLIDAIDEDIFTHHRSPALFTIVGMMMSPQPYFAQIGRIDLWRDLGFDSHFVDILRLRQPQIRHFAVQISQLDDVVLNSGLITDASIMSLALMYGLSLTCAILIHETHVSKNSNLQRVLESLLRTFVRLTGVLDNGEIR